jgi:hypothetical protein
MSESTPPTGTTGGRQPVMVYRFPDHAPLDLEAAIAEILAARDAPDRPDLPPPPAGIPPGGATGQVLAKASSADGDVEWKSLPEAP